jgi:hypothetical protein
MKRRRKRVKVRVVRRLRVAVAVISDDDRSVESERRSNVINHMFEDVVDTKPGILATGKKMKV